MRFIIQSPLGIEADLDNIDRVMMTLVDGKPLSILPRHAPLMAEIADGAAITINSEKHTDSFRTLGGIVTVAEEVIKILTQGMHEEADHD